jgi:PAS domain S-box-containing protein
MGKNIESVYDIDYCRILFENAPIGIQIAELLYDDQDIPVDFLLLDLNNIAAELIGFPKEKIIGNRITDFFPSIESEWFLKYGEVMKDGTTVKYEIISKLIGSWLEVIIVPLGHKNKFAILVIDITEKKKVEEELKWIDKNKNEFIDTLSHELRNPIATIAAGIELLRIKEDDISTLNIIGTLKRQTEYLSKLVNDLLDLTRIAQKKIVLNKEQVNLNDILFNAIEDMLPHFEEKGIELVLDICVDPNYVYVDTFRITQCLGNILRNALKFTAENGTVRISLKSEGKNAVIDIEDNGIGIDLKMLKKIFDPYVQGSNGSSQNKGLGIGLSLVKEFLEMHGGDICASSLGPGKGALFKLRLPIVEEELQL